MWKPESATLVEEEEWKPKSAVLIEPTPKKEISPKTTPITEAIKAVEPSTEDIDTGLVARAGLPTIPDPSAPPEGFVPTMPTETIAPTARPAFTTTPRDIRPAEEGLWKELSAIGQAAKIMTDPTTPEGKKLLDEGVLGRLENIGVRVFTPVVGRMWHLMGDVDYKYVKQALAKEEKEMASFGEAVVPAAAETLQMAIQWGVMYPALFRAAGIPAKAVAKIPRVAKATEALHKTKLLTKHPRLFDIVSKITGAFSKGATIGGGMGGVETIGLELEPGEVLRHAGKSAAILGTVAATFQAVSQVDTARYVKKLRIALIKASNTRFTNEIARIKATIPRGPQQSRALKGLETFKGPELKTIDNIVSAAEAQLRGLKAGKLYQAGQERVESPQQAANRFISRGFLSGKPYPKGPIGLKKGLGETKPFIKMPTTRAGEVAEQVREVVAHPVKAARAKAPPPSVKAPTVAKITPTRPVQPITPTKPTVTPKAEGKVEFKRLISPTTKGMYFNLNEETGQVAFLVPFKSELGHPDPRYQAKPVKATVADLAYHFAKLDKPIQKAFAKWRDEFAKKNPDKYNELINQPLTKGYLQPQEQAAPTPKPEVPAKPKLVDLGPAPEVKAVKKIPEAKVEEKPGPAKTLETIREEGKKKADITIVMPGNLEEENEFEKFVKQFTKFRSVGFPAIKAQKAIIKRFKRFAQDIPEFKLNPTFTFEKESGQLVFKDRYRFAFYPEHFGLDAEQLKDGQTIRFDLESFGIKQPTKAALRKAEPFLGEPKILGRTPKKPIPFDKDLLAAKKRILEGKPRKAPKKPTKAYEEYYNALIDIETGKKTEVPGGITISQVTEKDIERAARLGKKAGQKAWAVERSILARQERGIDKQTIDIGKAIKIIRGVFAEKLKPLTKAPKVKGKPGFVDLTPIADLDKILMGEIEPALETKSPAFNKHIDYFQKRQLPETSQIKEIQKQMRIVNGKRLAGTITAKEANKKIQQLRKLLFETAQKEGISVRMTKGGKVSIAVRKAGTYVPEEFSQYGKFKDTYPLGQDITRSVQQIDGALTVKEKVKLKGQAGVTERYVLWPTREMSKHKLEYIKEKSTQLKKIFKTKRGTKEDAQINIVLEKIAKEDRDQPIKNILNTKTIKALGVKPSVVNQAVELRKFYDDLIDEQNQARKMRNQEPIPYRHNYSPHILRDTTIWERMMMKGQKAADVIAKKADLPDYIKPNKPFNPREMAREAGIPYDKRVKSATELAESYLVTAAKDIFNTSIIQNNKAFIQQLETMGYEKPARFLGDWTAESYAGIAPALDRGIKLTQVPKAQRAMRYFNRIRNLAVFPLNFSWNLLTQTSSLALTVGRYGTVNTARGFYQWLHPSIRKQTAKDYYSYIVKSARQGKITRQDAQNLIGEEVKLRRTKTELARDISVFFLEQLEKLLTGTSIRAARLHGAKRGLTGEALKNYASDGGAKTQSMYNDEDKPALLRSVMVKTGAPYQTFAYEVMNTLREWAGRTGTPPDTKLYTIWTVLRFLAAATVFAAIAKKGANKDIWSWKRPPIPFAEFWLSPIIRIFSKEYIGGSASGLTSPVETARRVAKGIDDVLETNNWRKLRNELIKYGPGIIGIPGGVQWSRTVDAIIAYSQGGVRDRRGRLLFKMEDPQDLIQGIFSGVWTTKGGRAYLEKRTGKKPEGKRKKRMEREKRMLRK